MILEKYKNQVTLLLEVLPFVMENKVIALKGGTALNLFHYDMERLSVDIDLCYLPLEDRKTTFKSIHNILSDIKFKIQNSANCKVNSTFPLDGSKEAKLIIERNSVQIKIEPNYTIRG